MGTRPIWTLPISFKSISSFINAGYENVNDLKAPTVTPESLARDTGMPILYTKHLLMQMSEADPQWPVHYDVIRQASVLQTSPYPPFPFPSPFPEHFLLHRSSAIDICGPPGSGRGAFILSLIHTAQSRDEEILVIDSQSHFSKDRLSFSLKENRTLGKPGHSGVHYNNATCLEELLALINTLPSYLQANPKISLVVFSGLTTAVGILPPRMKALALSNLRSSVSRAFATCSISVVYISSLATRFTSGGGEHSNFTRGAHAFLVPLLELHCSRVLLWRDEDGSRYARLITQSDPSVTAKYPDPPPSTSIAKTSSKGWASETVAFGIDDSGRMRHVDQALGA